MTQDPERPDVAFYEVTTSYGERLRDRARSGRFSGMTAEEFYRDLSGLNGNGFWGGPEGIAVAVEATWHDNLRPEYKAYPAIVAALATTSIDIGCEHLLMPFPAFAIRLPEDFVQEEGGPPLRCVLAAMLRNTGSTSRPVTSLVSEPASTSREIPFHIRPMPVPEVSTVDLVISAIAKRREPDPKERIASYHAKSRAFHSKNQDPRHRIAELDAEIAAIEKQRSDARRRAAELDAEVAAIEKRLEEQEAELKAVEAEYDKEVAGTPLGSATVLALQLTFDGPKGGVFANFTIGLERGVTIAESLENVMREKPLHDADGYFPSQKLAHDMFALAIGASFFATGRHKAARPIVQKDKRPRPERRRFEKEHGQEQPTYTVGRELVLPRAEGVPGVAPGVVGEGEGRHLKCAHLRTGHLRYQAHGPSMSERKLVFIEPTIVRPDLPLRARPAAAITGDRPVHDVTQTKEQA